MSSAEAQQKEGEWRRRDVLYGALVFLGIIGVHFYQQGYHSRLFPGKWDFLTRPGNVVQKSLRKIQDSDDVTSSFPIVGPLVSIPDWRNSIGEDNVKAADKALDRIKKQRGWNEIHSLVFSQLYGVPDLERYVEPTMNYCRDSEDFLRNHKGLESLTISDVFWQEVFKGERYTWWHGTAFVAHSSYHVFTLKVSSTPSMDNPEDIVLPKPGYTDSSTFFFPSGKPDSWSFYISAASPSNFVVSPLIYLIYASAVPQFYELKAEFGASEAFEVQNAFCNSIGIALARELSGKLEIPRREGLVSNYERKASQLCMLLGKTQKYLLEHGMDEMAKKFVGEPVEFRNELRA